MHKLCLPALYYKLLCFVSVDNSSFGLEFQLSTYEICFLPRWYDKCFSYWSWNVMLIAFDFISLTSSIYFAIPIIIALSITEHTYSYAKSMVFRLYRYSMKHSVPFHNIHFCHCKGRKLENDFLIKWSSIGCNLCSLSSI